MAVSLNASLNVKLNPTSLASSSKQIQNALGRITGQASEFQKSLDASTARVFAFGATTAVINSVSQSFKKLVSTTIEVEKKLIEINSIFQATDATFNKFRNSIFKVAKETGQSFNTVADGAAELARQGLSAAETAKRLKAALVLTRISGLDSAKSVKALTAAINGFASAGLSANQIVNKMVAVDTAFAVSTQDLAEAFSRAGSTAEDAGVNFNELLGLVTAVEQRTARGGAVIGNAFKSIFTRISRGSTIDKLKELGVEIDSTQTGIQKLNALSQALQNVSDPTIASQIKELAGGVFQINVVSAALKDLSSDTSIFAKAAATASSATNEAFEKNAELSKSISSQINVLIQGLTSLSERIGTITFGPLLQNLLGLTTKFTEFLDKALDPEKGNVFIKGLFKAIGSFLSGPAVVIFTAAFVKIFKLIAKFAGEGLKSLFAVGGQTERIRSIEGGIVGLLQRDDVLRKTILSSTVSQAQKEQAVISAIQRENRELEQQAALMRKIASAAAARGVTGFNPNNGSFKGKRGKRFATGFMEEEATARALGASSNVQAHFGKGTIGGSRFVMNDNEVEIPNFAGGNSAVIPMYAGGNMPSYPMGRLPLNQRTDITTREQAIAKNYSPAQASSRFGPAKKVKKAKQMEDVVQVNPSESAMLVPNIGLTSKIPKGTAGRFKFQGKTMGFEYGSGLGVYGPKVPETVDGAADPQDERLRQNITRGVTTSAANYAGSLNPILGKPKPAAIRKMLERQGGGKGALRGVVGAAFEAAVNVGLGISPARKVDGGDFDIKGASGEKRKDVNKMFGVKNKATNLYDYKENSGRGSYSSYAKKLANEGKYKTVKREKRTGKSFAGGYIPKSTRRFAGGHMPKFAKGTPKESGGGFGGGGLIGGLFAMQSIVGIVNSKHQTSSDKITEATDARIKSIKESGREYTEIAKLTDTIKKEEEARKGTIPMFGKMAEAAEIFVAAAMTASTLNMVTGGGVGKVGNLLFSGKKAGTQAMKKAAKANPKIKPSKFMVQGSKAKEALDAANTKRASSIKNAGRFGAAKSMLPRVGAAVAVVSGLYTAFKTQTDETLEQGQKNERHKKNAGGVAGAMSGAASLALVGSLVGPIGTVVGGVVGGILGGMGGGFLFGDVEGEDSKVQARKNDSLNQAKNLGRLDFKSRLGFQQKVDENLNKVKSKQGFEAAQNLKENHKIAQSELAQLIDNQKTAPHDGSAEAEEKFAHERKKAEDRLNQATLKLVGRRFSTTKEEIEHANRVDLANSQLTSTTKKLNDIREKIAKKILETSNAVKKDEEQGRIRNSLATSISGPFAGAVGLASEQSAMFAGINDARFEKSKADTSLAVATKTGASQEQIKALTEAAAAAGEKFEKSVTNAAVSFTNKMASIEKSIEDAQKQRTQLDEKESKASVDYVQSIASGEKSGSAIPLMNAIKNLENFVKRMQDRKDFNDKFELNREQALQLSNLKSAVGEAASQGGLTSLSSDDVLKTMKSTLNEKLKNSNFIGEAVIQDKSVSGRSDFNKELEGGAYSELEDLQIKNKEARQTLDETEKGLKSELQITRLSYKKLNENSDTKALAANVTTLATEMSTAAASIGAVTKFYKSMDVQIKSTTGLIEGQQKFVTTQEILMKKVQGELDELSKWRKSLEP